MGAADALVEIAGRLVRDVALAPAQGLYKLGVPAEVAGPAGLGITFGGAELGAAALDNANKSNQQPQTTPLGKALINGAQQSSQGNGP